jgi:prolyl oligopeptidase
MFWVADLHENEIGPNMKWIKLFSDFDAAYEVVANDGTTLYIKTNKDAPQYKLIAVDLADKDKKIRDVIPEDSGALLKGTTALHDGKLAVVYQRNVRS